MASDFDDFEGWMEKGLAASQAADVDRLSTERASLLCEAASKRFSLDGAPARWWEALRRPLVMWDAELTRLSEIVGDIPGRCWLIPETGRERKPVYGLHVRDVPGVLDACPVDFEYYVVGPELSWIVMLSDHDQFYALGSLVAVLSATGTLYE